MYTKWGHSCRDKIIFWRPKLSLSLASRSEPGNESPQGTTFGYLLCNFLQHKINSIRSQLTGSLLLLHFSPYNNDAGWDSWGLTKPLGNTGNGGGGRILLLMLTFTTNCKKQREQNVHFNYEKLGWSSRINRRQIRPGQVFILLDLVQNKRCLNTFEDLPEQWTPCEYPVSRLWDLCGGRVRGGQYTTGG